MLQVQPTNRKMRICHLNNRFWISGAWCISLYYMYFIYIYIVPGCWINHLYKNVIKYPYSALVYIISVFWQFAIYIALFKNIRSCVRDKKYFYNFFFRCIKILDDIVTRFMVFIFKYGTTTKIIKFFLLDIWESEIHIFYLFLAKKYILFFLNIRLAKIDLFVKPQSVLCCFLLWLWMTI